MLNLFIAKETNMQIFGYFKSFFTKFIMVSFNRENNTFNESL